MNWKRSGRKQKDVSHGLHGLNLIFIRVIRGVFLVVNPQRSHDRVERTFKIALVLRGDGDHVEQLTVAKLCRDKTNQLSLTGSFIHVVQIHEKSISSGKRRSLKTTIRAQVAVALRKTID